MRLGEPFALFALVLVPLVLLVHVWLERRRLRRVSAAGDPALLEALVNADSDGGKTTRLARALLLALSCAFVAVALARPQFGMRTEVRKARGIDLVIALDLSKSMLARDVTPSRLQRARLEIGQLVDRLKGDRVGLVGFTSIALPLCPLTIDHSALALQLESSDPKDFPRGGTDIGAAIEAAQKMLESSKKTGGAQAILVITDGEENEGDPQGAAKKAKDAGIEVHVAGVGSRTGEPIPVIGDNGQVEGYLKDKAGQTVVTRLGETTLRQVADAGGGLVALPGDVGGLELGPIRARLSTLKRAELEDRTIRVYEERYQWLLVPAVVLLFAATILRPTRRRMQLVVSLAMISLASTAHASGAGPLDREDPDARAGNEHLAGGRAKDAIESYNKAMKRLGEDPRVVFNRGLASAASGELDAAVSDLKMASENAADPALRAEAAFALGNTYRKLKKWDDAIGAYKKSLIEDPRQSGARRNLEIAQRQKIVEAMQPRDPNQKNDEGDKPPPPNDRDGGTNDGGDDGGSGDSGSPDGGTSGDGGSEGQGQDSGSSQDQNQNQAQDAGTAGDGGSSPPPEEQEEEKAEPQDPKQKEAGELLDTLKEQEKALKRKRLMEKLKTRRVEKDW